MHFSNCETPYHDWWADYPGLNDNLKLLLLAQDFLVELELAYQLMNQRVG